MLLKKNHDNLYEYFKENNISFSCHAVSRLPRINKNNFVEISEGDAIDLAKAKPNFLEGDNKAIYFDEDKQLALIQNMETKDIVSIVRRKNKKDGWKDV